MYQWDDDTAVKYVETPHQRFDEHLRELAVAAMCKKHQQTLKNTNSRYIIGVKAISIYKRGFTISMDLGSTSLLNLIRKRGWKADKACIKALIEVRRGIDFCTVNTFGIGILRQEISLRTKSWLGFSSVILARPAPLGKTLALKTRAAVAAHDVSLCASKTTVSP